MDGSYYEAPPRRRIAGPLIAVAIAFLAGLALAAYAVHRWEQVAAWLRPVPVIAVASLPPAPVTIAPAPPAAVDSALAARVDALADRIAAIDQRAARASGDATRAEGLLVAFAARRALDRGQPLGFLEGMLRQRFAVADAQSVAMVVGAAQHPVTLPQLRDRLAALAPVLAAGATGEGWWAGFRRELKGLFVVHRADAPSALPADRLARAGHALEAGQVDVALVEVARLPASAAAAGWIAGARRYVLARTALDRIETAALLAPPPVAAAIPPAPNAALATGN